MTNPARRYLPLIGIVCLSAFMPAHDAEATTFFCAAGDVPCLIQSINEANTNGQPKNTIRLAAGTYTLLDVDNSTNGPNGLPSITSALTIGVIGTGTARLERASGAPVFRLLHVASIGRLILRGVTIRNGAAPLVATGGAGLFNAGGVVTMRDSVVSNNHGGSGAGLLNNGGIVTIAGSTFANNFGDSGAGLLNLGGTVIIADSDFEQNDALDGGGLSNWSGYLRISGSRIAQNQSHFFGGGLSVGGGFVSVGQTTFRGNSADPAGALWVNPEATVVVTNSSFVENAAVGPGGPAAIGNLGSLWVRNTTFADNAGNPFGGGAISNAGQLTLVNSTIVGTSPSSTFIPSSTLSTAPPTAITVLKNTIIVHDPAEPLIRDCSGPVTSRGNNLIGDLTGCTVMFQPGDRTGDAGLGAFTDDGTPGNGHFPLLKDSQAVDAGNDAFCPRRDQIGQLRRGPCDIGAIEFRVKKFGHHRWNDDDHGEGEGSSSGDLLEEGLDQPDGTTQTSVIWSARALSAPRTSFVPAPTRSAVPARDRAFAP